MVDNHPQLLGAADDHPSAVLPQQSAAREAMHTNIMLIRHGLTDYLHRYDAEDIDNAFDLTQEGIAQVTQKAKELAQEILSEGFAGEIVLVSSPVVCAVHTAKIYAEELAAAGLAIRKKGRHPVYGIKLLDSLTEVRGDFNWEHFNALVMGGELEVGGEKFFVDKAATNPAGLSHMEYFFLDAANNITADAMASWPQAYQAFAAGFERTDSVTERVFKTLQRYHHGAGHLPAKVLLVSHDCAAAMLMDMATEGKTQSLDRGSYISMQSSAEGLQITKAMGIPAAHPDQDILTGWKDHHDKRKEQ